MSPCPDPDPEEPPERWPDGWWALCASRALGRRAPLGVRRLGQRFVLWRDAAGEARAAFAACPHRGTDLSLGWVRSGELRCRYHGLTFDRDGRCTSIPCEGPGAKISPRLALHLLAVREVHGFVLAWFGAPEAEPLRFPEAPPPTLDEAVREMIWPVRLSRAVEAMLDLHHLPFAHAWMVPGGTVRLDPYDARFDEHGLLRSAGTLRRDDRPWGYDLAVDLAPPAFLHVSLTPRVGAVVALTPEGPESTWIGLRYYARVPVLGAVWGVDRLAAELAAASELGWVQPDDRRMVAHAEPRSGSVDHEHLVHADKAIGLWHAWRRRVTGERRAGGASAIRAAPPGAP
jgi:phenylpropionate dioxygenase-like ring-hydroxylating dioxygenase large terminal subunit